MKRSLCPLFLTIILLSSCGIADKQTKTKDKAEEITDSYSAVTDDGIMRAVWINYYELSMKSEEGGTEQSFTEKIKIMFNNIKNMGLNTVIVHVRPFSDAFYKSKIYPFSKYITGTQGKDPGYDPLKIICKQAESYGLKVHAWINPYRVLYSTDFACLSKTNPARILREDNNKENDDWIIVTDSGIFYNPSVPEVQKILIDGVREIIRNYDIDAIHMDDYFYPSTDESIDKSQYTEYIKSGGGRSLANWRRDNVNIFVSGLYSAIKSENKNVKLGISPAGDISKNFNTYYADIKEWVSNSGYIDYIMPQLYYGFNNETKQFDKVAAEWADLMDKSEVKICYGMAAYKCGQVDEYAGAGKSEWQENSDILSRQMKCLKNLKRYDGFILYSYQFVFAESNKKEMTLLKDMI